MKTHIYILHMRILNNIFGTYSISFSFSNLVEWLSFLLLLVEACVSLSTIYVYVFRKLKKKTMFEFTMPK